MMPPCANIHKLYIRMHLNFFVWAFTPCLLSNMKVWHIFQLCCNPQYCKNCNNISTCPLDHFDRIEKKPLLKLQITTGYNLSNIRYVLPNYMHCWTFNEHVYCPPTEWCKRSVYLTLVLVSIRLKPEPNGSPPNILHMNTFAQNGKWKC